MKSKKKTKEPKRWKNPNGNMCFGIPEHRYFEKPWIMKIAVVFAVIICVVENFYLGSYRLVGPVSILLFFFLIWWLDISARRNEKIIARMVHELILSGDRSLACRLPSASEKKGPSLGRLLFFECLQISALQSG